MHASAPWRLTDKGGKLSDLVINSALATAATGLLAFVNLSPASGFNLIGLVILGLRVMLWLVSLGLKDILLPDLDQFSHFAGLYRVSALASHDRQVFAIDLPGIGLALVRFQEEALQFGL